MCRGIQRCNTHAFSPCIRSISSRRNMYGMHAHTHNEDGLRSHPPPHTLQLSKALAFAAVASASAFVAPAGFTAQPKVRKCFRPSPQCPLCPDRKHKG
jgi:hypothetical protein